MYFYIFFALIVGINCYPQNPEAQILQQEFVPLQNSGNGVQTYSYSFTTSNGIHRQEKGITGPDTNGMIVRGRYYYTRPDGRLESVKYIADWNGFRIISGGIPEVAITSIAG